MAEQFSHIKSGTLDDSTKLDQKKNVKDFTGSSPSQIDLSQPEGICLIKDPKQESKKEFLHRGNIPHVDLPGTTALGNASKTKLDLSGQGLTELPKDLPVSYELEELNLSNNFLSHYISFFLYLHFPKLKKLDLSSCGLTELPKNLSYFSELEELNLSNNPLSHEILLSLECLHFSELKKLDLFGCGLTKLPKNLPYCHKLEELNLSNNPLNQYMSFFEHVRLSELKKLHLSGCGLTELPNDIHSFCELKELNVSNNPLSHDITFFQNVRSPGLEKLDLSGCGFTKLPTNLHRYCQLEEVNLSNNSFNHRISFFQYKTSRLKKLDLSGCGLTRLPEGLQDFRETLNFSNNPLSQDVGCGIFPHQLKNLDLSGCRQTELPKSIYNCFELAELNLSSNPLGHLHMSFSDYVPLYRLKKLDLSGCAFTQLPLDLRNFFELEELNLSNNPLSNLDIAFYKCIPWDLKKMNLSSCSLTKLPNGLEKCGNLHELNFSNNSFDHKDILEKLNSGKMFSNSECHQSSKELSEPTASGLELSKRTFRIIFEDVVYIRSSGVWAVEHKDIASTRYVSSTNEKRNQGQIRNKEIWLREFCHIRKSEKLTIETYYAMLQSLNFVCDLVNTFVPESGLKRQSTLSLNRFTGEILYSLSSVCRMSEYGYVNKCISNLKNAVYLLRNWFIHTDDDTCKLKRSVKESEIVSAEAYKALFSAEGEFISVATMLIISEILSNITKPEAAVLRCLQSLQELHDLEKVIDSFISLNECSGGMWFSWDRNDIVESVVKINKILFEFVGMFLKPPPTVEEWPATIRGHDEIFNPLIDGCWEIKSSFVVNKTKGPVTDAIEYNVPVIGETVDNSITVDQAGGCFSFSEVSAFLLFPPDAVEHEVTLQCRRVKFKESVKPKDGEAFVSRILKVEPAGVIFNKPVTVLLSHSLDEDDAFQYFYELIVENLSPSGWQELKTERISFIEDIPKEISNKKILEDHLPFAKATIRETCTLVAATRATFNQILIPRNRLFIFSKQYGDSAKLEITFLPGVAEKIRILNVQLFPPDAVLNKEIRLNKSIVYAPIIRVSGQTTPFLQAVNVELTYSHTDVLNIEENFLPVGKFIPFTTEYSLLMQTNNETESRDKWLALDEFYGVYITRLRKDQLTFSFFLEHFSGMVQPMVKTNTAVCFVPKENASMININNPACHQGIVLAVHKSDGRPKTLHAVLAPKHAKNRLSSKWKVEGVRFMSRLMADEPVYFCVPMPGVTESDHLVLKDYTLRFDPEEEAELGNNTEDGVDLTGKEMHFLKDKACSNGENHTMQGDCCAKVEIHISESGSDYVDRPIAGSCEPILDVELPQAFSRGSSLVGKQVKVEKKQKKTKEKNTFKDLFLDSDYNIRKEVHKKFESFSWLSGAYGLKGANKKFPRPHLYVTVKKGEKKSKVLQEIKEVFKCDPKKYFELFREAERKPTFKHKSRPTSGGEIVVVNKDNDNNPLKVLDQSEYEGSGDLRSSGTVTMFCSQDDNHYALTCFHVGCASDNQSFNQTFNNQKFEYFSNISKSLERYERYQYYYKHQDDESTDDNHNSTTPAGCIFLGTFSNGFFHSECDIMSIKVCEDTEIRCRVEYDSPNWKKIWKELYKRIVRDNENYVAVQKHGYPTNSNHKGRIVRYGYSYKCDDRILFRNAIVVKGRSQTFLEDGDSGALICFLDRSKKNQACAYGVCEVDELPEEEMSWDEDRDNDELPQEEMSSDENSDSSNDDSSDSSEDSSEKDATSSDDDEGTNSEERGAVARECVREDEDEANSSEENGSQRSIEFCEEYSEKSEGPFSICLKLDTALKNLELLKKGCFKECSGKNSVDHHVIQSL